MTRPTPKPAVRTAGERPMPQSEGWALEHAREIVAAITESLTFTIDYTSDDWRNKIAESATRHMRARGDARPSVPPACPECGLKVVGREPIVDGLPCGHPFHRVKKSAAPPAETVA